MNLPTIPHDKAMHAIYGGALAAIGGFHSVLAGAVLCTAVAVGWEIYQRLKRRGHPSVADALATVAGGAVVLAPLVAWRIQ